MVYELVAAIMTAVKAAGSLGRSSAEKYIFYRAQGTVKRLAPDAAQLYCRIL